MVPLQQDVTKLQRRLRLKPDARPKEITLDLRREIDRERSRLLHRLNVLEVPWGEPVEARGLGTFKEAFVLEWQPALELELIHAGRWGTTVQTAAAARATAMANEQDSIAKLATLADAVLLADLPDALEAVLRALADLAALDRDTTDLMAAVPPLAQILRYGDVRGSDTSAVAGVLRGVVLRSAVGLPGAAVGADEETGAKLAELVDGVNSALALLEDEALTRAWRGALRSVADERPAARARSPGAPPGSCTTRASSTPARWPRRCPARSPPARRPSAARAGSRGSSARPGSCSSTTRTCCRSSTSGSRPSARTRSPTSCRCCGARSPSCPRASDGGWASGSGGARARRRRSRRWIWSARDRRWRRSRGCSA